MKKLITAAALTAFAIASTTAFAEDTKQSSPTQKTPTEQQMKTQATGGAKVQTPAATTGAGASMDAGAKAGESKLPAKPTDKVKEIGK